MALLTQAKSHFGIYLVIAILGFATVVATIGSAQDAKSEKGKKGLKVTVLLYSGRPNPTFVLDDKDSIDTVKKLVGKSKTAETFKKETVAPSILGYNGIVVENLDRTIEQFPASLVIYKGIMEVKDIRKNFQNDEGGEIESFLLSKAVEKKAIDEKAFRKIKEGK